MKLALVILAFSLSDQMTVEQFLQAVQQSVAEVCCQTGYSEYSWCSSYCCDGYTVFDYNYCCYDYDKEVSYNSAVNSDCELWWTNHIWLAVVIGLGSLGTLITAIVLICCCIKGLLCKSRTPGRVVTQNPNNSNLFMMSNTVTQQGPNASGQYTAQMQPVLYTQGFEVDYTHRPGNVQPPPYSK